MALAEANTLALWLAAILLPLMPVRVRLTSRVLLGLSCWAVVTLGAPVLLVAVPAALAIAGYGTPVYSSVALLAGTTLIYPQVQSLPPGPGEIPLASFTFLALATWVPLLCFCRELPWRSRLTLVGLPIPLMIVLDLGAGRWIGPIIFANPLFRLALPLLPVLVAGGVSCLARFAPAKVISLRWIGLPAVLASLFVALVPSSQIREIVFDESHGSWETVKTSFGPDDFGRSANYTYSQLFDKARNLVGKASTYDNEEDALPGSETLFVIKMPAKPLSPKFIVQLQDWVATGGRLLVVADHTDLYNSAQNLNALLDNGFGLRINVDATYGAAGFPTTPIADVAGSLLGRINANGRAMPWQTGASLARLPLSAIELASFGPSFAEPGDYSRPNRFGPFIPTLSNRFLNHSALVARRFGEGGVAVLLDSTPWSNFSVFREQYNSLFRGVVHALEHTFDLAILSGAALLLVLVGIAAPWLPSKVSAVMVGLVFGCAMSAGFSIGSISWSSNQYERDFNLRVVAGPQARLEFLKNLIIPGERNYSRIVSSMGKYGLMPLAGDPSSERPNLPDAKRWLMIQPNSEQLPNYESLFKHLEAGGDLAILFAPEQAANPKVLAWLGQWGLLTRRSIGLGIVDSIKSPTGSFLGGRSSTLIREIRVVTAPRDTSRLNGYATDQFLQTYTLRPTAMPRTSGFLTIGFAAEQFSDDAIGDVWEGIYPSSIGRLRESQLAAVLLGRERPMLMPQSLVRPQHRSTNLPIFMAIENGVLRLRGEFGESKDDDRTTAYFRSLRDEAGDFILTSCPATGKLTLCKNRLLGEDMIEWIVSWRTSDDGNLTSIELLHERQMSGLGATWNVLFGH